MTYWLHGYCADCKTASPYLFAEANGLITLYPLRREVLEAAGAWVAEHCAAGHDVRLVHENDGNRLGPPNFPDAVWVEKGKPPQG